MTNQVNLIGLDNEKAQALANELNELLAPDVPFELYAPFVPPSPTVTG